MALPIGSSRLLIYANNSFNYINLLIVKLYLIRLHPLLLLTAYCRFYLQLTVRSVVVIYVRLTHLTKGISKNHKTSHKIII